MTLKRNIILLIIVFFGCKGQSPKSDEMTNAKWYFYSYSSTLTGYLQDGIPVNPLVCQIDTISVKQKNADTTEVYFNLFFKDTTNVCMFKPYDLIGIRIIKHKLYTPIYHLIVFDSTDEQTLLKNMDDQEKMFRTEILKDTGNINSWLYKEAVSRGVIQSKR